MKATITAIDHYVPDDVFDNNWFTSFLDTNDEWIRSRTGIIERRFLKQGQTSDMMVAAAQKCLDQRGITADEIDMIIVATITADNAFPSCAAIVQHKLGAKNAWAYDLSAACSGFLFALWTGAKHIEGGSKKILVCAGDKMSSILNFADRTTSVLFGDGAGCVLLEPSKDDSIGVIDAILHTDGFGGKFLYGADDNNGKPADFEGKETKSGYVVQDGQSVFKSAVIGMANVAVEMMDRHHLTADDIAWLVPHQANLRIIDATASRMGLSTDKVMINIEKYGNTTAGTIPLCLSELYHSGKLHVGDVIILASFGAGFTWGSILIHWGLEPQNSHDTL